MTSGTTSIFGRFATPAWSILIWTGIALLIGLHRYVTGWLGPPGDLLPALTDHLHYVLIWAIATPFILRSVNAFPVAGGQWLFHIALHLVLGTAFVLFLNLAGEVWNQATFSSSFDVSDAISGGFRNFMVFLPFALSIYGAVVGIGHVIRGRARLREAGDRRGAEAPNGPTAPAADSRLPVTEQYRTHLVDTDVITHIEADGHHVVIHTDQRTYRPRARFTEILGQLSGNDFIRIHRSHAVRKGAVAEVQTYLYGDCMVILHDGTRLRMSRTYRGAAESGLGLGDD